MAELIVLVLKLQLGEVDLKDDLFAQLRVDRDILEPGLAGHFVTIGVFTRVEPHLVGDDDDKLSAQPVCDGLIRLALAFRKVFRIALIEEKHKLAGRGRVVIALDLDRIQI